LIGWLGYDIQLTKMTEIVELVNQTLSLYFQAVSTESKKYWINSIDHMIMTIIKMGFNPNNYNMMHRAVFEQDIHLIEFLLSKGLLLDTIDSHGCTPLHYAAAHGFLVIALFLIEYDVDLNIQDHHGLTPLAHAVINQHMTIAKHIINNGKSNVDAQTSTGQTVLHYVASRGHNDLCKLLLSRGARRDIKNEAGHTALHLASCAGHLSIVEQLITFESDSMNLVGKLVNKLDNILRTPLHYAVSVGKLDIVILLLNRGAYPNSQDINKQTPLHIAAGRGYTDVFVKCFYAGGDINSVDANECTPLHIAVLNNQSDMVKCILSFRPNRGLCAGKHTAFDMALFKGYGDIARLICPN